MRCVASGEREPVWSKSKCGSVEAFWGETRGVWGSAARGRLGICQSSLVWALVVLKFCSILVRVAGRGAGESGMDLNGIQDRARPLWIQFEQGKEPLHRFFDARHAVQAVFARKRFAGSTFGRPMLDEESGEVGNGEYSSCPTTEVLRCIAAIAAFGARADTGGSLSKTSTTTYYYHSRVLL